MIHKTKNPRQRTQNSRLKTALPLIDERDVPGLKRAKWLLGLDKEMHLESAITNAVERLKEEPELMHYFIELIPNPRFGENARAVLQRAARQIDMAKHMPELIKAMENEKPSIRQATVDAIYDMVSFENKKNILPAIPGLFKRLNDKYLRISISAAQTLGMFAIDNNYDISPAVPKLITILHKKSNELVLSAIQILTIARENGADITPAIDQLKRIALREVPNLDKDAMTALAGFLFDQEKMQDVLPVFLTNLKSQDWAKTKRTLQVIAETARKGANMCELVDPILVMLTEEDREIIETASYALEKIAEKANPQIRERITIHIDGMIKSKWMAEQAELNSRMFVRVMTHCGRIMRTAQNAEANDEAVV